MRERCTHGFERIMGGGRGGIKEEETVQLDLCLLTAVDLLKKFVSSAAHSPAVRYKTRLLL